MPADTTVSTAFFPTERAAHILEHMNEDHADAVLNYARHFARRATATAAVLTGIDRHGIDLSVTEPAGASPVRIPFAKPLTSPDDAHLVLVDMARTARQPANGSPDPAFNKARAAIEQLKSGLRTAILGTADSAGEPDASVAPVLRSEDGSLHTYVSEMSVHTKNLRQTGRASLLVIEDESAAAHVLGRKRLTLHCTATFIERDSARFTEVMTQMKAAFGPVMQHLEGMVDFHVVQLTPSRGRLVAGFGQAFEVDPIDWTKLSHVSGEGKGHAAAASRK